jgi:hypothetical protein
MDDTAVTCVNTTGLKVVPDVKVFIPHDYTIRIQKKEIPYEGNFDDSHVYLVLDRNNGEALH